MKKSIFLLFALLVIGLTLVQAQDESYWMSQMEQAAGKRLEKLNDSDTSGSGFQIRMAGLDIILI